MATFTTIAAGTDWGVLSILNQFVTAYNEHMFAAKAPGWVGVDDFVAGDDIQRAEFWGGMQGHIEAITPEFVNHTTSAGAFDGLSAIPMWTWSDLKTSLSMDSGGWTRKFPLELDALTDATYTATGAPAIADGHKARCHADGLIYERVSGAWEESSMPTTVGTAYGTMEVGDYIGEWIFNEIQAAFDALRWTKYRLFSYDAETEAWDASSYRDNCADAYSDLNTAYTAATSGTAMGYRIDREKLYADSIYSFSVAVSHAPYRATVIDAIPDLGLAYDWEAYLLPTHDPGTTFIDLEGLGFAEDQLKSFDTGSAAAGATTFTTDQIGSATKPANPLSMAPALDCSDPDEHSVCTVDVYGVVKWTWSYTL